MPISSDPTPTQTTTAEARLLADCYALLLANIRQNRARRLAQNTANPIAPESANESTELLTGLDSSPLGRDEAHGQTTIEPEIETASAS